MILADKIIRLRKKNGWSQEELAEKMNVSRQAVSKWEGAQTIPDLEKILLLGSLFGVTTDYLIKDEIEDEVFTDDISEQNVRRISPEQANTYIDMRKSASFKIALATFLCIISPITLIILGAFSENESFLISEALAAGVGLAALFAFVLCAVPMYIYCGFKNEPYAFLDSKEPFELEYGVRGIVTERKNQFRDTYIRCNIIATCICIFSPVPLILSAFTENEYLCVIMLAVMLVLVAVAVAVFIIAGVQNESMQKLLKEGEYARDKKTKDGLHQAVAGAYWSVLVAVYLIWSFLSMQWHVSWIVFAVGGVLHPAVMFICDCIVGKKKD